MTEDSLSKARDACKALIDILGVDLVVYVDDKNSVEVSIEDVIAAAETLQAAELAAIVPELGDSVPDDPDVLSHRLKSIWADLDIHTRGLRTNSLLVQARQQDDDGTDDIADATILSDLLPAGKLLCLSPGDWTARQDELTTATLGRKMLFLFDRDFSEGDPDAGIKIIASLLARNDCGDLLCGLLTHTVTPETQPQQWAQLSSDHGISRDRFVLIPKLHLSKAPMVFAQMLKFVALSPAFTELKTKTQEVIKAASNEAARRVDEVAIHDLDHIVFRVSAEEGLWEPDMLFRLHALFHRMESRRLAHAGAALEAVAARLRAVSGIPTDYDALPAPQSAWSLQRDELYEWGRHINGNHLPLELGDVFERVGADSEKRYVLLAQPCDLMVRGDGKRHPELQRLPLCEIVPKESPPDYSEEMPYFDKSPTRKWFVKLKSVHFVNAHILDMCVFDKEGMSRLVVQSDAPQTVRPPWKRRHKVLTKCIARSVQRADLLAPIEKEPKALTETKRQLLQSLQPVLFADDLFSGSLLESEGEKVVAYSCRRIGRLSRARAIGLLMSYASTIGRPAYDREFGST